MRLGVLCLLDLCVLEAQHNVGIQHMFTIEMNIEVFFLSLHAEALLGARPNSGTGSSNTSSCLSCPWKTSQSVGRIIL